MALALDCPHCGGALPPRAVRVVVTCPYCKRAVSLDGAIVHAASFRKMRELDGHCDELGERVTIAGVGYVLGPHVASGASSEVCLARRVGRCTERVIIKRLRARDDADLLEGEWRTLQQLAKSTASGHQTFRALVPEPVSRGLMNDAPALVTRAKSGFVHTLDDVVAAYPSGVDPRHAVWIWRRILEVLAFVHASGLVHGAVLPEHVVLHVRDHGAALVGWSAAGRVGDPARLLLPSRERFYPASIAQPGARLDAALDLVMTARTVLHLSGSSDGSGWPAPLRDLALSTAEATNLPHAEAMGLRELIGRAADRAFGPPKFVHLELPGW